MPFRRLPALNSLRAFEAAARRTSFKGAADELSVTPAAISQQIRQLEEELGIQLFDRGTRSVALTEVGAMLRNGLTEAFVSMHSVVGQVRAHTSSSLSISCSGAIATKFLAPRLHRFTAMYPELEIQIDGDVDAIDPSTTGADVMLRFGYEDAPNLYAERLADEVMLPLASPELIERLGLREPRDMMRAPLLHDMSLHTSTIQLPTWPDWFEQAGLNSTNANRGLRFNSYSDQGVDAAVGGAGVLLGRLGIAAHDLKAGRLVCPFGPVFNVEPAYYIVCKDGTEDHPSIAAFIEWVHSEAKLSRQALVLPDS